MIRRSRRWATSLFAIILLTIAILYVSRARWLSALGNELVLSEAPRQSEIIVVLGGDLRGTRIMAAVDLMNRGFAPLTMISGAGSIYGYHESDLAVDFALRHGAHAANFVKFPYPAVSTIDEARAVVQELRRMRIHRVTVVTSNFHTRRAYRIFRAQAPDMEVHVASAGDSYFPINGWWHDREARKIFLEEWAKTFAYDVGL